MIKREILKTLTDDEMKIFVSKCIDLCERAGEKYYTLYSDFSNPVNTSFVYSLLKNDRDINVGLYGGFDHSERNVIAFSPFEINKEDFPVSPIVMEYNAKFSRKLSHRDFLGSLMSLGIKREKIGDILVYDDYGVVFVLDEVKDYILNNLEFAAHTKLTVKEENKHFVPDIETKLLTYTISSLRLDNFVSTLFNLSRKSANEIILSGKAFVNFMQEDNISRRLKEGDIITLRGYGRVKFNRYVGKSKKDKEIIEVERYDVN